MESAARKVWTDLAVVKMVVNAAFLADMLCRGQAPSILSFRLAILSFRLAILVAFEVIHRLLEQQWTANVIETPLAGPITDDVTISSVESKTTKSTDDCSAVTNNR